MARVTAQEVNAVRTAEWEDARIRLAEILQRFAAESQTPTTTPAGGAVYSFQIPGALFVATQPLPPLYVTGPKSGAVARALLGTAAAGAAVTLLLRKNGTPWLLVSVAAGSTQSPETAAGDLVKGDLLTFDVTGVGSSSPGTNLTIEVF